MTRSYSPVRSKGDPGHATVFHMIRRLFRSSLALLATACFACSGASADRAAPQSNPAPLPDATQPAGLTVNDVQSQLNATTVREIATPISVAEIQTIVRR